MCPQVHDGSYTPTEQFLKDPDSLCSTVSWRDDEDRVIWVYKIQVRTCHVLPVYNVFFVASLCLGLDWAFIFTHLIACCRCAGTEGRPGTDTVVSV